jgi:hypothetical protein
MTNTPTTTTAQPPTTSPEASPDLTYVEWVTKQIRDSKWYVGDGGFIAQAMMADTIEEATKTGAMISGRDHPGTRYRWLNATFADSELDGTLPLFAICDVIDPATGAVEKLTVGGARVTATLFRACEKEWFPFEASLESVDMGAGRAALNLVLAPSKVENTKK